MKKAIVVSIVIGLVGLLAFAGLSYASGKDDAKDLVKKAVAYVKYLGKERRLQRSVSPGGCSTRAKYMYSHMTFRALCLLTRKIRH